MEAPPWIPVLTYGRAGHRVATCARRYALRMAIRTNVAVDIDPEVASLLRDRAAEAHVSEGEIVERALRAFDLRTLVGQIRERSDLDEDAASALVAEELRAVRAERRGNV